MHMSPCIPLSTHGCLNNLKHFHHMKMPTPPTSFATLPGVGRVKGMFLLLRRSVLSGCTTVKSLTMVGDHLGRTSPKPSWPESPRPHMYKSPDDEIAAVCSSPAWTATTLPMRSRRAKMQRLARSPWPNWPCKLQPVVRTCNVPWLLNSATVWFSPQASCTTRKQRLSSPGSARLMRVGFQRFTRSPVPSCPCELAPNAKMAPPTVSAMLCCAPAAMAVTRFSGERDAGSKREIFVAVGMVMGWFWPGIASATACSWLCPSCP
mmetsp:Transcript_8992/g.15605  ORF Transcript_8992/g.15605 Transcript_8992/m.15605 type:complete len:263 (-) Transcript_8992:1414-2202(-)